MTSSFVSIINDREEVLLKLFREKEQFSEQVILVLNEKSQGMGTLLLSSNFIVWYNNSNEMFIIDAADISATGRSKFESDKTNCTVVIMDYYYKIEDGELEKCEVEHTLIVGYSFEDNVLTKSTELYTKLMSLMNEASNRLVKEQIDRGEDIDELAESDNLSDDNELDDMNWDGTANDDNFEPIIHNNAESDNDFKSKDGQFDDN